MVIETKGPAWFWQDSDGSWEEYTPEHSEAIEEQYQAKGKKKAITVGKDKFVSLADMKQFTFSGADKKGKVVKRENRIMKVVWSWENGDFIIQHWEEYNDDTAKKLEKSFLNKDEKMDLDSERFISFTKMRQIRNDNEKRYRNIRRKVTTEIVAAKDKKDGDDTEEDEEESYAAKDEKKITKRASSITIKDDSPPKDEKEETVMVVKWFWDKSSDDDDEESWLQYDEKVGETMEENYQKFLDDGPKNWDLDKERHINYRKMRQVRNDDHERFRKVKRMVAYVTKKPKVDKSDSKVKTPTKSGSTVDNKTPTKDSTPAKDTPKKDATPSKDTDTPKKDATPSKDTPKKDTPSKDSTPSKDTPKKDTPTKTTTTTTTTTSSSNSNSNSDSTPKKLGKRTYSDMSEEEKKELILKMLNDENGGGAKKQKSSSLLLPGEEDILKGKTVMKYCLKPNRFFDSSVADLHFRTAESQFHRLMENNTQAKVELVEYIVNPDLFMKFEKKREELEKQGNGKPLLAFHGTAEKNIFNICKINFCVPGTKGVAHATDTGWYGKGIYFSEYPDYSMGYIKDCTRLLLCKVLLGNAFQCKGMITGQPLVKGHDSHISPCGKELVIFSPDQILPIYVVHYKMGTTNAFGGVYNIGVPATALYKYSTIFNGLTFVFSGGLLSQPSLETIVKNNGGTVTKTWKYANYLITTKADVDAKSTAVTTCQNAGGTFIVTDKFLTDSVVAGKIKKASKYSFEKQDEKKKASDDEIKAVPLASGYDGEDDDGEDEKPLPMCKYGENCYRKNADHFKEFAHPWLIQ